MEWMKKYSVIFVTCLVAWVSGITYQAVELENMSGMGAPEEKLPWMDDNFSFIGDESAFAEFKGSHLSKLMDGKLICSCDQCHCANSSQKIVQVGKPTINGCGPEFIPPSVVKYFNVFQFKHCCDAHDACYGKCGSSRRDCDDTFNSCLEKSCTTEKDAKLCKSVAEMYYYAVRVAGCFAAFVPTQEKLCQCK